MRYWIYTEKKQTQDTDSDRPLSAFLEAFAQKGSPFTIAAVGAGGKSSLITALAKEYAAAGKQVLVTTTTHMMLPASPFPGQENICCLGTPVLPVIRQGSLIKCSAPSEEQLKKYAGKSDVILTEADGSRRLPVKIPGPWEPVIPDNTGLILAVYGLSALNRDPGQVCQRPELLTGLPKPDLVSETFLGQLMQQSYLEPLRRRYPGIPVIPVWNQADTPPLLESAGKAASFCTGGLQIITCLDPVDRSFYS